MQLPPPESALTRPAERVSDEAPSPPRRSPPQADEGPTGRDFLAMVGHELRSPLTVMWNVVKLCRSEGGLSRLPDALTILDRQVGKALHLVEDLLDRSQPGVAFSRRTISPVDMVAVLTDTIQDLDRRISARGQKVSVRMPAEPVWLNGDALRLGQIVWNLLDNASKFSEQGQEILIGLHLEGDWVVLRVKDQGAGIRREDLPHIFTRYFRGKWPCEPEQEGLGLGLAITRDLVVQHGGSIEVNSEGPSLGSEFTVRLPATIGTPY